MLRSLLAALLLLAPSLAGAQSLPIVSTDRGPVQAQPVVPFNLDGTQTGNAGDVDAGNSTTDPLGANATYAGDWIADTNPQFGFNVVADQPGNLYVEFSPDGGATITLSKRYEIRAGEARFDALVKLPGRAHRIRYVNGSNAQGSFKLLAATGSGLFPYSVSDRDEPVYSAYGFSDITAPAWAVLVDLSDTVNFPHADTGRVDLYSAFFQVDRSSAATGAVRLCVVVAIDGTDADLACVLGVRFDNSDTRRITRDRDLNNPVRLGQAGGRLTRVATSAYLSAVTAVNTATPLPAPAIGAVTPAIGDVLVQLDRAAGTYSGSVSVQYRGNVATN